MIDTEALMIDTKALMIDTKALTIDTTINILYTGNSQLNLNVGLVEFVN